MTLRAKREIVSQDASHQASDILSGSEAQDRTFYYQSRQSMAMEEKRKRFSQKQLVYI